MTTDKENHAQPRPEDARAPTPPPGPAAGDSKEVKSESADTVGYVEEDGPPPSDRDEVTRPEGAAAPLPRRFGRYEVRSELGRGGYGTVFLGYDGQLNRKVAIKVPNLTAPAAKTQKQFLQEARQLAQLKHPGIVTVFDVGIDGDSCYIVSDYLEGRSLSEWIREGRSTWQDAVRIAAAMADALAHAHSQRIVHRDLKPSNVILTAGQKPVLVDFGLAVSDTSKKGKLRGVISGTPAYMSPEQARGEGHRIDGRTDIYALGVILYRMLTGRLPFHAADVEELLKQIIDDEPQPPRQLSPEIPREVERVCLRALAKQLGDRYLTAADMAEELLRTFQPSASPPGVAGAEALRSPGEASRGFEDSAPATQRRAREAERRRITVVQFGCDLFGSETVLSTLDPEEQHEVLLAFRQLGREVSDKLGGAVVEETDHGLRICFGFPTAFEDAPHRAVQAGLDLFEGMVAFNAQLRGQHGVDLSAVVAVHSDLAVVQDRGSEARGVSIVGSVLNVTDQLEGLADAGTVVISEDTLRLVKGFFDCEPLGSHRIKGLAGEKALHRVLRRRAVSSRVDVARAAGLTPLIGREHEVALLAERWECAVEGTGQVVLLLGEAGIGKSRLVHVLKEQVLEHARSGIDPIIEWRCTPQHQSSSLYPAVECFERLLGLNRQDPARHKLEKVIAHLGNLNLRRGEETGLLASLLSIPQEEQSISRDLNPQQQKENTLDLLVEWLRALAGRQPILFIVEDLHWVDPTTLEFMELLVGQVFSDRILVLLTFRPEFEVPWKSGAEQTQVSLGRLTKRQIGDMMTLRCGVKKIPQRVIDQVIDRTEGVPLFVEEFTAMVVEAGRLREVDGEYELSDSFPINEIPATLQDLLMTRLDRMGSDIEVAQLAATIGREFSYELLHAVAPHEEPALQDELNKLVRAELLFLRGRPPRARYQFKHALIQDAAYQSLLRKKRQQFHQRIGEVLAGQFAETVESQPELLAHHFSEANLPEKAIGFWERAGERSIKRCAYLEAIRHLQRGLDLLKQLPPTPERQAQEIQMHIRLGAPLQSTRGYSAPEVAETYSRAYELCQQLGQPAQLFPVLYGLFRYHMLQANYRRTLEIGEQLVQICEKSSVPGFFVGAHRALGATLVYQGQHTEALLHLKHVLAVDATPELRAEAFRYDVVDGWVAARSYLTWALWLLGCPEQATLQSMRAIAMAEDLNHPFSLALALSFATWLHHFGRSVKEMRQTAEKALKISTEMGFDFWIGWNRIMLGGALTREGRCGEAVVEIEKGLVEWKAQGSELGRGYFLSILAEAQAGAGKIAEALDTLAAAAAFADERGEAYWRPEIARLRGEFLLLNDPTATDAAEACFRDALDRARAQQARSLELRAALNLARLVHKRGGHAEAKELLSHVLAEISEGFDTADVRAARGLLLEFGTS